MARKPNKLPVFTFAQIMDSLARAVVGDTVFVAVSRTASQPTRYTVVEANQGPTRLVLKGSRGSERALVVSREAWCLCSHDGESEHCRQVVQAWCEPLLVERVEPAQVEARLDVEAMRAEHRSEVEGLRRDLAAALADVRLSRSEFTEAAERNTTMVADNRRLRDALGKIHNIIAGRTPGQGPLHQAIDPLDVVVDTVAALHRAQAMHADLCKAALSSVPGIAWAK